MTERSVRGERLRSGGRGVKSGVSSGYDERLLPEIFGKFGDKYPRVARGASGPAPIPRPLVPIVTFDERAMLCANGNQGDAQRCDDGGTSARSQVKLPPHTGRAGDDPQVRSESAKARRATLLARRSRSQARTAPTVT